MAEAQKDDSYDTATIHVAFWSTKMLLGVGRWSSTTKAPKGHFVLRMFKDEAIRLNIFGFKQKELFKTALYSNLNTVRGPKYWF